MTTLIKTHGIISKKQKSRISTSMTNKKEGKGVREVTLNVSVANSTRDSS
jgi:hypothetical protein